jgi:hypothetical protein
MRGCDHFAVAASNANDVSRSQALDEPLAVRARNDPDRTLREFSQTEGRPALAPPAKRAV